MTTGAATLTVPEFEPCPYQNGWRWMPPIDGRTANFIRILPGTTPDQPYRDLEWFGKPFDADHPHHTFPLETASNEITYRAELHVTREGCLDLILDAAHFCEPERTQAFARGLLAAQRLARTVQATLHGPDRT